MDLRGAGDERFDLGPFRLDLIAQVGHCATVL
jgi:hypothetical protein